MTFGKYLLSYVLTLIVFLIIDLTWLGVIAKGIYQRQLGHLMSEQINWLAAIAFYFLFVGGVFFFVILPAVEKGSLLRALWMGAFFGLVTYATYDLTNLATLRGFPASIVWIDLLWGCVLTATVSCAGYWVIMKVK